jgi:prophage regulatory protein
LGTIQLFKDDAMQTVENKTSSENRPPRFIRIRDVMNLVGLSKSHIYCLAAQGKFPKSIPLVPGGTSVAWIESEIEDYINQQIKARG